VATISATGLASTFQPGTTTITATSGSISGTATLTVTQGALQSISITPATPTVLAGSTLQLTATGHYAGGFTGPIATAVTWTPATPAIATVSSAGLATGVAQGTTTVTASSGAAASTPITLTVAPTEYAYSVNFGPYPAVASTLAEFSVGPGGELLPLAAPNATVATGVQPFAVIVDPTSSYVYVTNYDLDEIAAGTVSEYSIGAGGALTPLATPSVAAGAGPQAIAIATINIAGVVPGYFAYVANYGDGSVSQYISEGAGGELTPLTPASVAAPAGTSKPADLVVDPTNKYVYVANYGSNDVSQWVIGDTPPFGGLTANTPATVAAGTAPTAIAVDPAGKYVYVANSGDNTLSEFSVGTTGALTPLSTATIATGKAPTSIAIDPTGKYLYVTNGTDATVSQYSIAPTTGLLTSLGTAVATLVGPQSITVDANSQYVYVANRGTVTTVAPLGQTLVPQTQLSMFTIGATGALTPLTVPAASPGLVTSGTAPVGVTTTHH
jgi:YVTN family beta-propeller protein